MSKLHIFNPSHEMAMADNSHNFQASKRVVLMERQLAALPLWWAEEGDSILVDDKRGLDPWHASLAEQFGLPGVKWVEAEDFVLDSEVEIAPWGWNKSLARKLPALKGNPCMSESSMDAIRSLSSRETAVGVLQGFPSFSSWTGEACFCTSEEQVDEALARFPYYVLKALWSSSGRGVMLMQSADSEQARQLCSSFLRRSGGLVIEPQYDKVQDFAMEFWSDGRGQVTFAGYSFFQSVYGRYAANLVAPSDAIEPMIQADPSVLSAVRQHLERALSAVVGSAYKGALGVDMMVVNQDGQRKVHPCVEINLRMNMGWLALLLAQRLLAEGQTAMLHSDYQKPGAIWDDHQKRPAPRIVEGRLQSGYLALTPVFPDTQFRIYIQTND